MSANLILFDIDGTMLSAGGAGMGALEAGIRGPFPEPHSSRPFPALELGGATDGGIVAEIFDHYSVDLTTQNTEAFYRAYLADLGPALDSAFANGSGKALAGVAALIAELTSRQYCVGLLTGNIERAAHMKLTSFGFDPSSFPIGAFGDDNADRNELGPIAIERANRHYEAEFEPDRVFIIGDTIRDIGCARACGAQAVAVATGAADKDSLADAQPDYLFQDLSDVETVLSLFE